MEKISILLAVYNPNIPFFVEQLKSLNNQDYRNLELIIINDSPNKENENNLKDIISKHITSMPFSFFSNPENLGSNRTFEELTKKATGDYFAYCDQDDIWEAYKLSTLLIKMKEENAVIAYSDLSIIDEDGNKIANSFKDLSKRLVHNFGDNLFGFFLRRNSITGCTMLIKSSVAKQAVPFPPSDIYVHDHWLALYGSSKGKIAYVDKPLIRYRIHSNNQIGAKVFQGIDDKKDYYNKRILIEEEKVKYVQSRDFDNNKKEIKNYEDFITARKNFFERKKMSNIIGLIQQLPKDPVLITFEAIIGFSNGFLSKFLIKKAKK